MDTAHIDFTYCNTQLLLCICSGNYPEGYFRNPLNIPIQLAANFGELRPDHFHMGLDIRTQSKENLPVFAAADGYVSHIRIEKYGYGKAIFITHSNGCITVYAHLNFFYDSLEQFVKSKQYADEKWEQDFDVPAKCSGYKRPVYCKQRQYRRLARAAFAF